MNRPTIINAAMAAATVPLLVLNIACGAVDIPIDAVAAIMAGRGADNPTWTYIVTEARLPQAITAVLCGASLAVSGLLLQTAFRNPLAGPSIFGINSGASLGAALVLLAFGGGVTIGGATLGGSVAVLAAAFAGAAAVMLLLLAFAGIVKNNVMLLIVGIMIGYIASSAISLLNFFATEEGVHSYMLWGLGNFGGVPLSQIPLLLAVTIAGLAWALLLVKPLDALLLGEQYAENLGVSTIRLRNQLLAVTGLLTATATAFCGPVAFIGLAVPHMSRIMLATDSHRHLVPSTILTGAAIALLCNIVCTLPGENGMIPLNAITPVMGAPVIIYVITRRRI